MHLHNSSHILIPSTLISLFLASALPHSPHTTILSHHDCGTIATPSSAYKIYSASPNRTDSLRSTNASTPTTSRRNLKVRNTPFLFQVSQSAHGMSNQDLVLSFTDLPCPPSGAGPFSFEFNFVPQSGYKSNRTNNQINVFAVNGTLPANPSWANVGPLIGSLIGTFELPSGSDADQPRLIYINQLVCMNTISLRFGISIYSNADGAVAYFDGDGMGLRERSGC